MIIIIKLFNNFKELKVWNKLPTKLKFYKKKMIKLTPMIKKEKNSSNNNF